MKATQHPAIPAHLPWFIAEPGQMDLLLVLTGLFLLLFVVTIGALMFRILYLPAQMVSTEEKAKYQVVATLCVLAMFSPGHLFWIAALILAMTDIPDFTPVLQRITDAVRRIEQSRKEKQENSLSLGKETTQPALVSKPIAAAMLALGLFLAPAEAAAASCSSYYISEITLVSVADTEAGRVQTFVGFGASKEDAEKNALGSCSRIQQELETCVASDRINGRNAPSDGADGSLHLRYAKAVKRITGCD